MHRSFRTNMRGLCKHSAICFTFLLLCVKANLTHSVHSNLVIVLLEFQWNFLVEFSLRSVFIVFNWFLIGFSSPPVTTGPFLLILVLFSVLSILTILLCKSETKSFEAKQIPNSKHLSSSVLPTSSYDFLVQISTKLTECSGNWSISKSLDSLRI